jgi:RNA polymerase sigma-70 factor (ECF subfamily)
MKDDLLNFHHAISDAKSNQDSFEVLYIDFFTPIYKYVFYRIRNKEITMDIVQTVFLKAFANKDQIRKHDALKYLYTIARNQLIDHLRKKHTVSFDELEHFIEKTPDDSILDPEKNTIIYDEKDFIQKALSILPELQREIITLRYLQELEYPEIAAITGKNEEALRQIVSRAMRVLHKQYTPYEN